MLSVIFYISLSILLYTYIVYPVLLYVAVRVRRLLYPAQFLPDNTFTPPLTFVVAAYNEATVIREKIQNTLQLDYPAELLHLLIITDGSTDDTPAVVQAYPRIQHLHRPERRGKTAAINRAMPMMSTPYVVFSDANTLLNQDALRKLMRHFADKHTGAVAGEKKVLAGDDAAAAGEGMYWKYESKLKAWDADLYSVMGAAGELLALRTALYVPLPEDTVLDDFMLSFRVNIQGYKVQYEPAAYAMEQPSASLKEEYKRKVRIAAGGFQSMYRLKTLLNIFMWPRISWQYISHRVLRWTLAPLSLSVLLITNFLIVANGTGYTFWALLALQCLFYLAAFIGYRMAGMQLRVPYFYIPFYFVFMNIAVYHGCLRYLRGKQSAVWEKSVRHV